MPASPRDPSNTAALISWVVVAFTGLIGPVLAIVVLLMTIAPSHPAFASATMQVSILASVMAVALMGAGMIGAAAAQQLKVGFGLAVVSGGGLLMLAYFLGIEGPAAPIGTGITVLAASFSFAARGALFARSAQGKGWWIAVFVLAGEAAVILTALIDPQLWPEWLLALLPAQWASLAFQTSLSGTSAGIFQSTLVALSATAVATLLVAIRWPAKWPYAVMFTTWLAMAALVYSEHYAIVQTQ